MLYGHFSAPNFQMFQALRPNLDKDIYDLACACVDKDHKKRPTAYQLFERIRNNISNKKGPADFPGKPFAEWESDEKIRAYMEEMLALDT
jgi:hypothetical protein